MNQAAVAPVIPEEHHGLGTASDEEAGMDTVEDGIPQQQAQPQDQPTKSNSKDVARISKDTSLMLARPRQRNT